jgi:hypothetical protein
VLHSFGLAPPFFGPASPNQFILMHFVFLLGQLKQRKRDGDQIDQSVGGWLDATIESMKQVFVFHCSNGRAFEMIT